MADDDSLLGGPLELPGEPETSRPTHKPHKRKRLPKPGKKPLLVVLIVIVVIILLAGGWKLINHKKSTTNKAATGQVATAPKPSTTDIPEVSTTKTYKSDSLALDLTYPSSWTTTETADTGLRIESPTFRYQTIDKGIVSGNFRIYIRQQARDVDAKYIGRGVAVQPSEPLTYTKPAPTQRQTTFLTDFGLDTPNQFAYFMIAGNFNLKTGQSLGPNYGKEQGTYIISGGYSGPDLKDDMQTNQVPLKYFATTNAYKQAIDVIKSLQLN